MGMFDDIVCKYPLPLPEDNKGFKSVGFQTEFLFLRFCVNYFILKISTMDVFNKINCVLIIEFIFRF